LAVHIWLFYVVSLCKPTQEYGYITGRSLAIKGISLLALFLFVKTRQDYVAYALISSLATGGNYVFNVIHARKFVKIRLSAYKTSETSTFNCLHYIFIKHLQQN